MKKLFIDKFTNMSINRFVLATWFCGIFCAVFFSFQPAFALVEKNYIGYSKGSSLVQARKKIFKQAVDKTSAELIKEMIGSKKYSRNREKIYQRVIKKSGQYIPYIRSSKPTRNSDGSVSMTVTMKISMTNLRTLLLRHGLMYKSDKAPVVLPFITYFDRINLESYRWWEANNQSVFLLQQQKHFTRALRQKLMKKGFFVYLPHDYQLHKLMPPLVPPQFSNDHLKKEDYLVLGRMFGAQVVIYGQYKILRRPGVSEGYKIDLKLYALHTKNGRVLGEVQRTLPTESGDFSLVANKAFRAQSLAIVDDLTVQVFDTWQKGIFGSSVLKVSLQGPVPYNMQKEFKKAVRQNLNSVKNLRERLLSADQVRFEMDVSKNLEEMKKEFALLRFDRWRLELEDSEENHLLFRPEPVR